MSCTAHHLTRLSDIQIVVGWNALHNYRYHLGANIRIAVPTGNRPEGEFLFEPIIGNSHHWEVGGGISTHIVLWENELTEEKAGLYFDANITHLFTSQQCRSFDICNKAFNSRYMLAERMTSDITHQLRGIVDGAIIAPNAQYNREVTTIANITTIPVNVSISLQADLALLVTYTKAKNSWGFGYGFWGRSCEDINFCSTIPFDNALWALKGDAMVFGFAPNTGTPIPLSATQSNATIHHGLNFPASGATTPQEIADGKKNLKIDNPALAIADNIFLALTTTPGGTDVINTSVEPIILTSDDVDIDSGRTKGHAHKIFAHFTHTVMLEKFQPYLSLGGEIEFGQGANCSTIMKINTADCVNTALSFWGVWIKSGVAF